ncbi:siphovirus ReqiPepy6 Gp37-like family protein [Streptomyces turgidiscabies]|uniref:siphovirus ReqiPepy6 Gp37-like family protein n=1 Tax=Streptomyces turgidiscabies TaxID=85558 RepID=UPI0038F7850A
MSVQILITDRNLAVQGDPLDGWTSLDVTKRFNEPGSGSLTVPARPDVMAQLQPGNRLVVIRDGSVWLAGPMEIPTDFSWSLAEDPGWGSVTVNFSDDLATVAGFITWPTPANAWDLQPANTSRQITNTNAETIIRQLVTENCGPAARTDRRIPAFALDTVAGVGTATTASTRFEPLLDVCRRVAVDGGKIGFRTRQTATQLLFGCYAPRDLTSTARFSVALGNLRSIQAKRSAPTVTHALVAGTEPSAGTTGRAYLQVADAAAAASWWRVEKYVDGSADNNANGELTQAGNQEIAAGAAPVQLATVTVDTDDLRAGRDFDLGDRVTVALPYGVEITDLVRSIHLQASPESGEYVSTLVGSPEATTDPEMVKALRTLGRRLGRLETR